MEQSPLLLATIAEVVLIIVIALIVCIRKIYLTRKALRELEEDHTQLLVQHDEVSQQKEELEAKKRL